MIWPQITKSSVQFTVISLEFKEKYSSIFVTFLLKASWSASHSAPRMDTLKRMGSIRKSLRKASPKKTASPLKAGTCSLAHFYLQIRMQLITWKKWQVSVTVNLAWWSVELELCVFRGKLNLTQNDAQSRIFRETRFFSLPKLFKDLQKSSVSTLKLGFTILEHWTEVAQEKFDCNSFWSEPY